MISTPFANHTRPPSQLTLSDSMNCVLYARVSTEKQADKELSIPAQLQAMRGYAQHRGWHVDEEFIEPGASAKTAERPALQSLLARVRDQSRQTDVVLVHKVDRLARNVYDHATIKALFTQHCTQLASVVENVDDTVPGQLVENIMASIAQFYSANLSEEVKKGMRQKVQHGGWPHKPPRGYVIARRPQGGSQIERHRREGILLAQAFELYATGHYSVKALAARLAKEGLTARSGQPLAVSYVRRLLTNPFYVGRIRSGALEARGNHTPLVSEELFKRVQEVIAAKYRNPGVKGSVTGFPLRGLAICVGCRGRMTAERHGRWSYYRCGRNAYKAASCRASFCNAAKAHDNLAGILRQIRITKVTADAILAAAQRVIKGRVARGAERLTELAAEQSALLEQEMQLTAAFAAGDISPNAHTQRLTTFRERRGVLERERGHIPQDPARLLAQVSHILQVGASMWDLYDSSSDLRRAELVQSLFNAVVLSRSGVAGFTLKPPFDQLAVAGRGSALSATTRDQLAGAIVDAA